MNHLRPFDLLLGLLAVLISSAIAIAEEPASLGELQLREQALSAELETVRAQIATRLDAERMAALAQVHEAENRPLAATMKDKESLRKTPAIDGATLREMRPGTKILILGCESNHWRIVAGDQSGWIDNASRLKASTAVTERLKKIRASCYPKLQAVAAPHPAQESEQASSEYQALVEKNAAERKAREEAQEAKALIRQAEVAREERARAAEAARTEAARRKSLIAKYGSSAGQKIADRKIWLGMTEEMARESWGGPKDINRTVSAGLVHEQWVYPSQQYLYFENGILTSWQD